MGSRRHLASVAEGVARAFAMRNNDVDGWWALGLLLAAVPPGDPDYRVDLLTGAAAPVVGNELGALGDAWARYLRWSLQRHGIQHGAVRSAELQVRFNRLDAVTSWIPGGRDYPFKCTVVIEDDRGRRYQRAVEGHCSRPDDFVDPNPNLRPRRSVSRHDPGRVSDRIGSNPGPTPSDIGAR